jgi:RIO-like serine/threonine protein kinase
MEQYFDDIVNNLTIDEMTILGILYSNEANAAFKATRKEHLQKDSELTEAKFRKSIQRLDAIKFIDISTLNKEYRYFITSYGHQAVVKNMGG